MKHIYRLFSLFICLWISIHLSAQIPLQPIGNYYILTNNLQEIDCVILFKEIDGQSAINYTGSKTPVKWYDYDGTLLLSNSDQFLMPDDENGYRLIAGTGIFLTPVKYCPVRERGSAQISSKVPAATISPP